MFASGHDEMAQSCVIVYRERSEVQKSYARLKWRKLPRVNYTAECAER